MSKLVRYPEIPANESPLYLWFFKWYTYYLSKIRFQNVYYRTSYTPDPKKSTLFLANHHYWWDGLIPLLMNEFVFRQGARAIMEDKQMARHPFFSKIGAFSIDRNNPRHALTSLLYGAEWLKSPGNSLFVYPEGKITSPYSSMACEKGFSRIIDEVPETDVVALVIHISHHLSDKPSLFIDIQDINPIKSTRNSTERVHKLNNILTQSRFKLGSDAITAISDFRIL